MSYSTYKAPTIQTFLKTDYYTFTVTAANASIGATYTNNTQTFTVVYKIAGGTTLVCSATGAPTSSGTLTKASGTGDSTISFSSAANTGTYQLPINPTPLYLIVEMVGGGGGGAGATGGTASTAGNGGNTTFGSILTAGGGSGGALTNNNAGTPGSGGTNTVAGGTTIVSVAGSIGGPGIYNNISGLASFPGGNGGCSPFGGAGAGGAFGGGAYDAASNSGSGGGGGAISGVSPATSGTGGGSGGYIKSLITSPSSTYAFTIGAGGTKGPEEGSGCSDGGNGGSGQIIVTEYYQ